MNFKPLDARADWELQEFATGKYMIVAGAYILARFTEHPTDAEMRLVIAAVKAAREINPDNPIAAAEAMPEIFRLLEAVVIDARKVSHGKLDLEQWLKEADDAILKATAKE